MSFLSSTTVTIDAILTTAGRAAIAQGIFNPTQFALSDDEINYILFNPNHPSGSAYFGEAIINSPINEAYPDETQVMKCKLVTLPPGTSKLPVVSIGYNSITLKQGASLSIQPQTLNYQGAVTAFEPSGYVITVGDGRLLSIFTGIGINQPINTPVVSAVASTNVSITQIGTSFTLAGTTINTLFNNTNKLQTQLTVVGRDSGASIIIPLTVTQNN